MTTVLDRVAFSLQKLKSLSDLSEREKLIQQLKSDLTFFQNIPPCESPSPKECILAREVYEHATMLSVEKNDIREFELHMSILKSYYDDLKGIIPDSQKMYSFLGLYLLYLLSQNK